MAKSHLKLVTPATEKRTVTPKRRPNSDLRSREHLTETEVDNLLQAAKRNRWGHRDSTNMRKTQREQMSSGLALKGHCATGSTRSDGVCVATAQGSTG